MTGCFRYTRRCNDNNNNNALRIDEWVLDGYLWLNVPVHSSTVPFVIVIQIVTSHRAINTKRRCSFRPLCVRVRVDWGWVCCEHDMYHWCLPYEWWTTRSYIFIIHHHQPNIIIILRGIFFLLHSFRWWEHILIHFLCVGLLEMIYMRGPNQNQAAHERENHFPIIAN